MSERQLKLKAKSPVPLVGRCIESIAYFVRQSGSLSLRLSKKETGIYQGKTLSSIFAYLKQRKWTGSKVGSLSGSDICITNSLLPLLVVLPLLKYH